MAVTLTKATVAGVPLFNAGNFAAQYVYERNGWKTDNDYYLYNFQLVE